MAKQLNVNLAFTADTSQAKAQIQQLQQQLAQIGSLGGSSTSTAGLSANLQKAITSANQLQSALRQAVDPISGSLNLTKFQSALSVSNTSVKEIGANLLNAGTVGEKAFMGLQTSIQTSNQTILKANGLLSSLATTFKNTLKWQVSSSVLHGIMSSISSAVNYAKDLDESLTNIQIVTNNSADEMARFAKEANKAAQALSTTTTAYTDAALIYYQQGLSSSEVEERTNTTIKMAEATGDSATEVSSYMTAIWNNFDDGSESLEHYADVITALGASTASSSAEIAEGLEKFAAVADTVGLSYDYATSALATVVANTRQSADTVGTALKTLFSRVEGLKLGETLDDGTDLNKYSTALATVGVNIKDSNGELRNMDDILDDLASKWETLAKDEQVALAETVGGVRQYNTLISLMDNWDDMKTNLGTADDSEGTLQQQADTYADSWEAARRRVQSSLEEIYNQLIDRDFMKDVDNFAAGALNVISSLIEGMGGLQGIILLISNLLIRKFSANLASSFNLGISKVKAVSTELFGAKKNIEDVSNASKKMGESIGDTNNNLSKTSGFINRIKTAFGSTRQNALKLEETLVESAKAAKNLTPEFQAQTQRSEQLLNLRRQYVALSKELSTGEQQYINSLLEEYNLLSQNLYNTEQESNAQKRSNEILIQSTAITRTLTANTEKVGALIKSFSTDYEIDLSKITNINEQFREIIRYLGELTRIQTFAEGLSEAELKGKELKEVILSTAKESGASAESIKMISQAFAQGNGTLQGFLTRLNTVKDDLQNITNTSNTKIKKDIEAILNSEIKIGNNLSKIKGYTNQAELAAKEMENTFKRTSEINLGKSMAKGLNTLTSGLMGITSLKNAIDELNDTDVSFGQKMLDVAMSISFMIPAVTGMIDLFKDITKTVETSTGALNANTIAEGANSAAKGANATTQKAETAATASQAISLKEINTEQALQAGLITEEDAAMLALIAEKEGEEVANAMLIHSLLMLKMARKEELTEEEGEALEEATHIIWKHNETSATNELTKSIEAKNRAQQQGVETDLKSVAGSRADASSKFFDKGATESLKESQDALNASLNASPLVIFAVVAALLGLATYLTIVALSVDKVKEKANNASEQLETFKSSLEDAQTAASNLNSTISEYKEGIDGLKDLTSGTQEMSDAVEEANEKARDLIETYKLFDDYHIGSNGEIVIEADALEEAERQAQQVVNNAQITEAMGEIYNNNAQLALNRRNSTDQLNTYRTDSAAKNYYDKIVNNLSEADFEGIASAVNDYKEANAGLTPNVEELKKQIEEGSNTYKISSETLENLDGTINEKTIGTITSFADSMEDATTANKYYAEQIMGIVVQDKYGDTAAGLATKNGVVDEALAEQIENGITDLTNGQEYANGQTVADFVGSKDAEYGDIIQSNIDSSTEAKGLRSGIAGVIKSALKDNLLGNASTSDFNKAGYANPTQYMLEHYGEIFEGASYSADKSLADMLEEALTAEGYQITNVEEDNGSYKVSGYDANGEALNEQSWDAEKAQTEYAGIVERYIAEQVNKAVANEVGMSDSEVNNLYGGILNTKDIYGGEDLNNAVTTGLANGIDENTGNYSFDLSALTDDELSALAQATPDLINSIFDLDETDIEALGEEKYQAFINGIKAAATQEETPVDSFDERQSKYDTYKSNLSTSEQEEMTNYENNYAENFKTTDQYNDLVKANKKSAQYEVEQQESHVQVAEANNQGAELALGLAQENFAEVAKKYEMGIASLKEYNEALALQEEAETRVADTEENLQYAREDLDEATSDLENTEERAEQTAKQIADANYIQAEAIEDLADNSDDYLAVLNQLSTKNKKAAMSSKEYQTIMSDMSNLLGNDLVEAFGSSDKAADFLSEHLGDVKGAMENDLDAIERLRKASSEGILNDAAGEVDATDAAGNEINVNVNEEQVQSEIDKLNTLLDNADLQDIEAGVSIDDVDALNGWSDMANQLLQEAPELRDQISEYLNGINMNPEFSYIHVPLDVAQQGKIDNEEDITVNYEDDEGNEKSQTYTFSQYQSMLNTDGTELLIPQINGDNTTSNGGVAPATSVAGSNSGGSSGGSHSYGKKRHTDTSHAKYDKLSAQTSSTKTAYDKLSSSMEKAFGKEKLDLIDKQIKKQKELAKSTQALAQESDRLAKKERENLASKKNYVTAEYEDADGKNLTSKTSLEQLIGFGAEYDKYGNITNKAAIEKALDKAQNKIEEAYDADNEGQETNKNKIEAEIEAIEDYISQYEEDLEQAAEDANSALEEVYNTYDLLLEQTQEEIDIKINVDDRKLNFLEYLIDKIDDDAYSAAAAIKYMGQQIKTYETESKTYKAGIKEIIDTHNKNGKNLGFTGSEFIKALQSSNGDMEKFADAINMADYNVNKSFEWNMKQIGLTTDEIQGIEDYADKLLSINQSLASVRENVFETMGESFSEMVEDMDDLNERIKDQQSIIEHYSNMIDIIGKKNAGVTTQTLKNIAQTQVAVSKNLISSSKTELETIKNNLDEAKAAYANATSETDKQLWEEQIKTYEEAYADALENFNSYWEDALQQAEDAFSDTVTNITDDLSDALAGAASSMEAFTELFDMANEENEDYIEDYEKIYQLTKLNRQLSEDIEDSTDLATKQKMLKYEQELNEVLQSDVELSEYDVENYQKRLELLEAEKALKEAKEAKSTVTMTVDAEGNYGYVYTADEDSVNDAEQNYEDKLYALQQANAEYIKNLESNFNELQNEVISKMQEAADTYGKGSEEYAQAMTDIQDWYVTQLNYYSSETNKVLENNHSLYENEWADYSALTDYKISANEKFVDSFEETILSQVSGYTTIVEYANASKEAVADAIEQLKEADTTLNKNIVEINIAATGDSDVDYGKLAEEALEASNNITSDMSKLSGDIADNWSEVLKATTNFEETYSKGIDKIIDKNETLINSLNGVIGTWSGLSSSAGLVSISTSSFDTGGYTGEWGDDGRLAVLHQKELVLNSDDTENVLDLVNVLRSIDINSRMAQMSTISQSSSSQLQSIGSQLEQTVHITAEFPNATDRNEILSAFDNVVGLATQYAQRK